MSLEPLEIPPHVEKLINIVSERGTWARDDMEIKLPKDRSALPELSPQALFFVRAQLGLMSRVKALLFESKVLDEDYHRKDWGATMSILRETQLCEPGFYDAMDDFMKLAGEIVTGWEVDAKRFADAQFHYFHLMDELHQDMIGWSDVIGD